ncbi:MAG TPA: hypothetical protein VJT73_22155 [Polyangiaceae bacterium]|nr:hypothetical protein [Polyangiaceae bacterium]
MQSPYTASPNEAYLAAQSSVAAALTALLWFRRQRPWPAMLLIAAGIWGCALAPAIADLVRAFGAREPVDPLSVGAWSSTLVTLGALFFRPRWIGLAAIAVRLGLSKADAYFTESTWELVVLHLMGIGLLIGLAPPPRRASSEQEQLPHWYEARVVDVTIFVVATALAAFVSVFVLARSCDSADEWSYTFQASVFAKGRAYAAVPPCMPAFQNFWVFWKDGRMFSQYPPGWPLFCVPFVLLHAIWLAAPVAHGLLAVGVARLSRRAMAESAARGERQNPREIAFAGIVGAVLVATGSSVVINGASRFPHTLLCALFAWSIEASCVIASPYLDRRRQMGWGAALGSATSVMLATRPADGAMLGIGVFLYFIHAVVRRRVGWRAFAATATSFSLFSLFVLGILHLQLGAWFQTGYSLTSTFHPWASMSFGLPKPNEYKWPFPLATGSYCWWPCAPAVGVAGMASLLFARGRRLVFMLSLGVLALLGFYMMVAYGRGWDFGYGPRYQMPVIVPMAVGGAVATARMLSTAFAVAHERLAIDAGGPATLFLTAGIVGLVCVAILVYPYHREQVRLRNVVFRAAEQLHLRDAVVVVSQGSTISDQLDLTQNLPLELYPNQDFLVISDRGPEVQKCVKDHFPGRRFYRAVGRPEVKLEPE